MSLELLLVITILALVSVMAGMFFDQHLGVQKTQRATVLDKFFKNGGVSTGVGPSFSPNGPGVAVTMNNTPDEYHLLVEYEGGEREIVETNEETLLSIGAGDKVVVTSTYGKFTGILHEKNAQKE